MLLDVGLQHGVEMLKFPVCDQTYYVDLAEDKQNSSMRNDVKSSDR